MAISAGVGLSKKLDSFDAGKEAAAIACEKAGGGNISLVIVFSSIKFDQAQMLKGVRSVTGSAPLVGCSDAGEIVVEGPFKKAVAVIVLRSDAMTISTGLGSKIDKDARAAGREVAEAVKKQGQISPKVMMILPDGLAGNGADIVRGVQDVLGAHFPVVGGSAGDDFLFKQTYEYFNQDVLSACVPGVLFGGDISFGIGVRHGWSPIGEPRKVTEAKANVIKKLDGKPAVSIYEDYFGKRAEELREEPLARMAITYPLGMSVEGIDEYLIRDTISVGPDGSLVCAAEVPQGSEVRLMVGSKEAAIEAARAATKQSVEGLKGKRPAFSLIFNCIARDKLLGRKAQDEISAIKGELGEDVPIIGFYTYGEQATIGEKIEVCQAHFHNETVVILTIGE